MSTTEISSRKRIGILGGTFDPPHVGHLKLATHFAKLFHLDALLFVPSGEPWQKGTGITSAQTRYQLTEAAGIDLARAFLYLKIPTQIGIDRIEIDRVGPSYAIDTVKALRDRFGSDASLIWLMGADSLNSLPSWNSWNELPNYVNFAVASRPHHELETNGNAKVKELLLNHQTMDPSALENQAFGLIYIDETLAVDLSSTKLREQLKTARNSIEAEAIPSQTLKLIHNLGLYQ
ncbi:nicotinate (nicotinamide) nucleotide adenylyltransferase [Polynucleobacter sp. MWH-UH23A]|uniref:nicotinate (nicotinamide) nucleotide adenylyltransferase n=1 Tax=Polynucleobacter sp. MWH-UH23A TaxID=1855613 RepID=UPI0033651824